MVLLNCQTDKDVDSFNYMASVQGILEMHEPRIVPETGFVSRVNANFPDLIPKLLNIYTGERIKQYFPRTKPEKKMPQNTLARIIMEEILDNGKDVGQLMTEYDCQLAKFLHERIWTSRPFDLGLVGIVIDHHVKSGLLSWEEGIKPMDVYLKLNSPIC